jgi:hypothetical protein
VLSIALGAMLLCAAGAPALVVRTSDGGLIGIALHRGLSPSALPGNVKVQRSATTTSGTGNLDYHGGPVLQSSAPYLIFWDPSGAGISTASRALLERYFADLAVDSGKTSNVYSVDWQYTDGAGDSAGRATQFTAGTQAINDPQPFPVRQSGCSIAATYPNCVTDGQLQSEISRLIAADGLPTGTGAGAPIYFVVTPGNTNICSGTSCASNTFCAFHSFFSDAGAHVLYSTIPLFFDGASSTQDPKACQADGNNAVQEPNGDIADVAIKYLSHEDNETITDPLLDAWFSTTSGNEDGDNCNFFGTFSPANGTNPDAFEPTLGGSASSGTLFNQVINSDHYYIQSEWSNAIANCTFSPATIAVSISPTSIFANGKATTTATATVTNNGMPISGQSVTFKSSDAGEKVGPVTDNGNGTYTATITASTTVGKATITATDQSVTPAISQSTTLTQTKAPKVAVALKNAAIVADGIAHTVATATVTIGGVAANGLNVVFSSSDPGETLGPVTNPGSGKYEVTISASHTVGSALITASVSGTSASVTLKQVSPSIHVSVSPTSIAANGQATSVVTVTVQQGLTGVNGDMIAISSSDPGQTIGPVTNSANGKYTAKITSSTTVGTATITATDTSVSPSPSATTTLKQT